MALAAERPLSSEDAILESDIAQWEQTLGAIRSRNRLDKFAVLRIFNSLGLLRELWASGRAICRNTSCYQIFETNPNGRPSEYCDDCKRRDRNRPAHRKPRKKRNNPAPRTGNGRRRFHSTIRSGKTVTWQEWMDWGKPRLDVMQDASRSYRDTVSKLGPDDDGPRDAKQIDGVIKEAGLGIVPAGRDAERDTDRKDALRFKEDVMRLDPGNAERVEELFPENLSKSSRKTSQNYPVNRE